MTISDGTREPSRGLRLWPGVIAVAVQWSLLLAFVLVVPAYAILGVLGGVACGAVVAVWWLFFSRAPWVERLGAIALMMLALYATSFVVDRSIANGMMGMMLRIYSIPVLSLALVAGVSAGRRLPAGGRRAAMAAAILIGCAAMTVVRTGGVTGDGASELHWRWTQTPEERLLAQAAPVAAVAAVEQPAEPPAAAPAVGAPAGAAPAAPPARPSPVAMTTGKPEAARASETAAALPADPEPAKSAVLWSGFRGAERDGIVRGVHIDTDWAQHPPAALWRRAIGPGWSSFAVRGDLVYTQEQRGDEEIVSAYRLSTGEPVWRHRDPVRFWESNGGAGPRATPTLHGGRVYTFGATGLANALDARTGAVVWTRNAAVDTNKKVPAWGFASSPLIVDDLVVIAVSGQLVAYDLATGKPRWFGPSRGGGYASPHLVTIDGVRQIVLLSGGGAASVAPADGSVLWEHAWQSAAGFLQPAQMPEGDLLITAGDSMGGVGVLRVAARRGASGWTVDERWTSRGLKPYFNDLVVHRGHAFGFDGSILSCIDLENGERKWKGGRYGHGQLLLLPDQDLLLVLSEEGELALVRALPDGFSEVARVPAIEGKTWNHPALAGDVVLVRNGEEMAAFRLSLKDR